MNAGAGSAIPMLDLEPQHAPIGAELRRALDDVLSSNRFILGGQVAAFERELSSALSVARAVGMSSGTDALLAMLMACGVQPGDEVITTPYSFFATAEAIVRLGARPVFADVEPDSLNLDPTQAAARIGPRTAAIVVVHLFGRMARTAELAAACRAAAVPILEDAAQAIDAWRVEGGSRQRVGTAGRGAALSFFPAKNLGGFGDGGMVLTNDPHFAELIVRLRSHGVDGKLRHAAIGGNFRLDEIQAALLRVKLAHLDVWNAERAQIAAFYRERLTSLPVVLPPWEEGCVWNQFVVRVEDRRRESLIAHLRSRGISSAIYYPVPLHLQPALGYLGNRPGSFPIAERAATEALALPIFPGLGTDRAGRVADALADFFR